MAKNRSPKIDIFNLFICNDLQKRVGLLYSLASPLLIYMVTEEPLMISRDEGFRSTVMRPVDRKACIVMVCASVSEADHVGKQLSELNMGCLVTYRRAEDLMYNAPTGKVVLVILATADSSPVMGRTLQWLRRRWPRCPVTVIGDEGGGEREITARSGGASYLARPVTAEQWSAMLGHALGEQPAQSKQIT